MGSARPRRRVQVCATSPLGRRPDILAQIAEAGAIVEKVDCLDQCTRCSNCTFALVAGHFMFAASPEEFVKKL